MSFRLEKALKKARLTDRRCAVRECDRRTEGVSRYCNKHKLRAKKIGHPEATTIHAYTLRPYLKLVRFYLATTYADHPEVQATLARITALPSYGLPWLKDTPPETTLAIMVACYLIWQHDPECFKSPRHFQQTVAVRVVRSAFMKHSAGRLNVTQLRTVWKTLKAEIGKEAMSIALAIFKANSTSTPDGTYLLLGVNIPVDYKLLRCKFKSKIKDTNDYRR